MLAAQVRAAAGSLSKVAKASPRTPASRAGPDAWSWSQVEAASGFCLVQFHITVPMAVFLASPSSRLASQVAASLGAWRTHDSVTRRSASPEYGSAAS